MNVGYAFVDLYEYNTMLHNNIKAALFKKELNRVIFDHTLSKLEKYDKLEDIIMNHYNFTEEKAIEAVAKYRERYQPIGIYECNLYPGVEQCIRELKNKGYLIGMASSKPELSCRKILEHFNIIDLFDDVVGATFDGKIDTKEEVLNEVMRRWKHIDKNDMCLIGDTLFDVEGANQVGIKTAGVSFGFGDISEMKEAGAVTICDSMDEVIDAVEKILG